MIWETILLAFRSIFRNALRSILTMLGIVIGVAAVIAMLTIGQGSSRQVTASIESLGADLLIASPGASGPGSPGRGGDAPAFDLSDADALGMLEAIRAAAPIVSTMQTVVAGNASTSTTVTGTTADYLETAGWTLAAGRWLTPEEGRSGLSLCILGTTAREKLFGAAPALGQAVRVKSVSCEVIGLLASKGSSAFGRDQDDVVLMPVRTVQRRLVGTRDVQMIALGVAAGVSKARAMRDAAAVLSERRRIGPGQPEDFTLRDMAEIASMLNGVNAILTGMLSSVAAVSLLVGGIGVMNVMLVSVTERTREIGIRLSVGALAHQVLLQFLVEAIVLSLLGGAIGIALGLGISAVACQMLSIPFRPDLWVILMAFGFSASIGVIFGYFPARRAARLDPIDALRHQ